MTQKVSGRLMRCEPIAITGIGCRFPGGAHDPQRFWELLCNGVDAIVEVPAYRWNRHRFYDPNVAEPGKLYVREAGFLCQPINEFDSEFFGMSPREAARLDPQQRLLLEVTWEALEDAGQSMDKLAASNTGVFIGGFMMDHALSQVGVLNREHIGPYTASGSSMTMLSARIAYEFDLRGPTMSVDTACSSSLVATHYACMSLWNGECSMAIAGGANVMLSPDMTIALCKANMLAPDGRCKAFDSHADGYGRGEGAGVVVLKLLPAALADGDPIYALILSSAVNQDGHTPTGITVPNQAAQEEVLRLAYQRAGVSAARVHYVEAHGTGTPVGDPIEARALGAVLGVDRPPGRELVIGSVKTNIGHLEAASGIAGLIKAALCLRHRQIPPHLHLGETNPDIPLDDLRLRIPTRLEAWPGRKTPRTAGVSSFGFGGTNAHVVLGEMMPTAQPAPNPRSGKKGGAPLLLAFSAGSKAGLRALADAYRHHLRCGGPGASQPFSDIAYSLVRRRSHLVHRLALVASDATEAADVLEAFLAGASPAGLSIGRARPDMLPKLVWVFTGMGPQWWGMGQELFRGEPVFRSTIERCHALLRKYTDWSLLDEFGADEARSRMNSSEVAQMANFALQVALVELWRSWGTTPDAVIGHSVGEVAAAHAAGALSLESAIRLCHHRSRLLNQTARMGGMMAASLSVEEAEELITASSDALSIAAVNGPRSVTLSGDIRRLESLAGALASRHIFHRMLAVNVPYHSHYLDPLKEEFLAALEGLEPRPPSLRLYSTVTGRLVEGVELDARYWWRNARFCVNFLEAVRRAGEDGCRLFLEVGPHPVLSGAISECLAHRDRQTISLHSLHREKPERWNMLATLGKLYTSGCPFSWEHLYPRGRFVSLPRYPWQRERHWSESEGSLEDRLGPGGHPLLGTRERSPHPAWTSEISTALVPHLDDHRIDGDVVFPAAGYIEIALAADRELQGEGPTQLEQVHFQRALVLRGSACARLHVFMDPRTGSFTIHSAKGSSKISWTLHASGRRLDADRSARCEGLALDDLRCRMMDEAPTDQVYAGLRRLGYEYGPAFQGISRQWTREDEVLSEIVVPEGLHADTARYRVHPAVLDACLHSMILPAARRSRRGERALYLPVEIDRLEFRRSPERRLWCHARLTGQTTQYVEGDIHVFDDAGEVALVIRGVRARQFIDPRPWNADAEAYRQVWKVATKDLPGSGGLPKSWLILADRQGVGKDIAGRLRCAGHDAVLVLKGKRYKQLKEDCFRVVPDRKEHFQRLALAQSKTGREFAAVIYLWSLDSAAESPQGPGALEAGMGDCGSVMHLIQSMALWKAAPRLWLVTRGAESVSRDDPILPAQSLLWGIARTLFLEHPEFRTTVVDLNPEPSVDDASVVFRELLHDRNEEELAIRGDIPYVHRFQVIDPASLPSPPGSSRLETRAHELFQPQATYLIAGGLGGFGLATAAWMVEHGARHIALLGRRGLATQEAEQAVRDIERAGARVRIVKADVRNAEEVARALAEVATGMPALRGIVDAVSDFRELPGQRGLLARATPELIRNLMSAKVLGAWNLHAHTRHLPLDFFVMFSSIGALIGSVGAGHYVAANVFLDAFAHYRRSLGLHALSINWGAVADAGVLARHKDLAQHNEVLGNLGLPVNRLLAELGVLLQGQEVQIGVGRVDLDAFVRAHPVLATSGRFSDVRHLFGRSVAEPKGRPARTRALLALEPSVRAATIIEQLRTIVAMVLESSPAGVAVDIPLREKGVDSLACVALQAGVESDIGVVLPLTSLLEGPSIEQMAAMVLERLPSALDSRESQDRSGTPEVDHVQTGLPRGDLDVVSRH